MELVFNCDSAEKFYTYQKWLKSLGYEYGYDSEWKHYSNVWNHIGTLNGHLVRYSDDVFDNIAPSKIPESLVKRWFRCTSSIK